MWKSRSFRPVRRPAVRVRAMHEGESRINRPENVACRVLVGNRAGNRLSDPSGAKVCNPEFRNQSTDHDRQQYLGPGPRPIETKVNRHSFYTWFKPTSFVADDGHQPHVRVPNAMFRDWLTKHYAGVIGEALAEVHRRGCELLFVTDDGDARPEELPMPEAPAEPTEPAEPVDAGRAGQPRAALLLRHLHRRPVEPVRARRVPRRRRSAVALVQPAVHLRRRGTRQDPPDARDRALRAEPSARR